MKISNLKIKSTKVNIRNISFLFLIMIALCFTPINAAEYPKEVYRDDGRLVITQEGVDSYKCEMTLKKGWSFISIPIDTGGTCGYKMKDVFNGLDYEVVQVRDPLNPSAAENGNVYYKAGEDLDIKFGKGYYIKTATDDILTLTGKKIQPTHMQLYKGWNFVGYIPGYNAGDGDVWGDCDFYILSQDGESRVGLNSVLTSIEFKISDIWNHEGACCLDLPPWVDSCTQFKPGESYQIKAKQDCVWEVNPTYESFVIGKLPEVTFAKTGSVPFYL